MAANVLNVVFITVILFELIVVFHFLFQFPEVVGRLFDSQRQRLFQQFSRTVIPVSYTHLHIQIERLVALALDAPVRIAILCRTSIGERI